MDDPTAVLPRLVLLTGPESGRRIPLTTGRTAVIGRSLGADLTFPDEPSLSDLHARIERAGEGFTIVDLGSAAGTRLNGVPIGDAAPLLNDAVIRCGALELRFEWLGDTATTSPTRPSGETTLPRIRAVIAPESRPVSAPTPPDEDNAIRETVPMRHPAASQPREAVAQAPGRDEGHSEGDVAAGAAPASLSGADGHAVPPATVPPATLAGALRRVPIFRHLTPAQRAALAEMMAERRYEAGTEIVRQGEEGLSLFVILEGEVQVQRGRRGASDIELATIEAGGFFGEMTVLDGLPRSATVRALTNVHCALLPRWALDQVITAQPGVAMEILAVLSRRLRETERLITA